MRKATVRLLQVMSVQLDRHLPDDETLNERVGKLAVSNRRVKEKWLRQRW
jgi:hypothetical protein